MCQREVYYYGCRCPPVPCMGPGGGAILRCRKATSTGVMCRTFGYSYFLRFGLCPRCRYMPATRDSDDKGKDLSVSRSGQFDLVTVPRSLESNEDDDDTVSETSASDTSADSDDETTMDSDDEDSAPGAAASTSTGSTSSSANESHDTENTQFPASDKKRAVGVIRNRLAKRRYNPIRSRR
ncbi:hypothetical protein TWF696_008072 [Orbilia brochopaga]|uniref:Uncharacterized protein n=1 Tax=Orbilia brochopaga TaxID=3140254 RepID=A0AAV9UMY6_9PEZI